MKFRGNSTLTQNIKQYLEMTAKFKFVKSADKLADSVLEFHGKPEFWKAALGSGPRYFVHVIDNGVHIFGLSKFCAFKNIVVEDYLKTCRYETDGGTTQKHIARLTGQVWQPRSEIESNIRDVFDDWILSFFPNYRLENAFFITLTKTSKPNRKKKKPVTPKDLQDSLKLQVEIGDVGEKIAMLFEVQRLKAKGVTNPIKHIDQVSKRNSAAGYDIYSSAKDETRYIEVKSSLSNSLNFFITENEVQTLEVMGAEAYLYLVNITDLKKNQGEVFKVVNDPIKTLKEEENLKPIAYRAEIKPKKSSGTNLC